LSHAKEYVVDGSILENEFWASTSTLWSRSYLCGHCGKEISSNVGYRYGIEEKEQAAYIYICHACGRPTYFLMEQYDKVIEQVPGGIPGKDVMHLPPEVEGLYREARQCCQVHAYTASALCSRKLIMSIAVDQGAAKDLKFIQYVNYLDDNGYLPPKGKVWVDHIRDVGNDATHKIAPKSRADAEELIVFLEMLLCFIYEFPARIEDKHMDT
jgi:DNA-directed RNA polymerase subunit RPC12/RpoP